MTKREKYFILFIIVLLFLLPFLWSSQNLYNLGGDDSKLYFYSPSSWLKNIALYSWFGYFGSYNPSQSYVSFNVFSIALQHLFPFLNLQKMIYGLILSFGFLMTFLVIREFLNSKSKASYYAAILGGFAYIFSPLLYYTQWVSPLSSILGIVGYPTVFFFLLKAIRERKIKYLIAGALISLLFSVALSRISFPWLVVFLVGISLFYLLYIIFFPRQLKLVIKYGVIYILFIILINALWFLPESYSFLQHAQLSVTSALSVSAREVGVHIVKAVAPSMNIFDTLINLVSRGPRVRITGYIYGPAPLSLFLPLIIFLPPLLRKKEEDNFIFKLWFALAIPTLLLAYLQTVNIWKIGINFFNLFVRYLPGWSALRNFYHKVPPAYVFFYSLTLGVSLYIISKSVLKESVKRAVFAIIFLVVIFQALPFIRGDINNLFLRPDIDATRNVKLPSYYFEALDTIKGLEEGKVLSLPLTFASWSFFKSQENNGIYIGFSPILVFTGKNDFNGRYAFDNGDRFMPGLTSLVKEAIQSKDYEFLKKLFGLLHLRYIFYNSEIYEDKTLEKIRKPYLWGGNDIQTKDNIERLIKKISDKRIGKFGPISIYEISSRYYYPTIYSTNKVILTNKETFVPSTLRRMKYPVEKPVFLFSQQLKGDPELKVQSAGKKPRVEFREVNPTRYVVRAKGVQEPFWLVFSEAYHSQWRAYVRQLPVTSNQLPVEWSALVSAWKDRGKRVELKEHHLVNGYANGWYVPVSQLASQPVSPSDGEMEIVLEFVPQRLFEIGVLISGLAILSCVGYLVGSGLKRRKKWEHRAESTL